jgi:hypothetical protein
MEIELKYIIAITTNGNKLVIPILQRFINLQY